MAQNWAFKQLKSGGAGNSYPIVFSAMPSVVVGDTILVLFGHSYPPCAPSVSDNLGNTYTRVVNGTQVASTTPQYAYFAPVTTGGSCVVTVTAGCGVTRVGIYAAEYSNLTASPYDDSHSADASTNSFSSGNVTTTAADDLLVGIFAGSDPMSVGSGTSRFNPGVSGQLYTDQNVSAAGTAAATAVSSGTSNIAFAYAWKQSAGATVNKGLLDFF